MTDEDTYVFRALHISDWRQFREVALDFHPQLTVLTGANASGKSTLLGILGRHFNWPRNYSSAPEPGKKGMWTNVATGVVHSVASEQVEMHSVGRIAYGNGGETDIAVPIQVASTRTSYGLHLVNQQNVDGVFLTSHRQIAGDYVNVTSIPTAFSDPDNLLDQYEEELRKRYAGSYSPKTPQLVFKEALMAAAVFGGTGNTALVPDAEATAIWEGYQSLLRVVLPESLGFDRLRVRNPDMVIETRTGNFILDDVSGGISALMEMTWQIYLRSRKHNQFCVLLDEPENHLHPSLQRELLPALLEAFPGVQFIVATHSPFVVTAASDSVVHVLDYDDEGKVGSERLDLAEKAVSAEQTLHRVLGVPSTMPIWAEKAFDSIVQRRLKPSMSHGELQDLRDELRRTGLASEFPLALARLAEMDEK